MITVILAASLLTVGVLYADLSSHYIQVKSELALATGMNNPLLLKEAVIHTTYYIEKDGELIAQYHHPGAVTQIGMNFTLGKIVGAYSNSTYPYNATTTLMNCTFVSIGDQGSLTAASRVLPGEWNRTRGTVHDATYNSFNITAVFYPDTGPYTADCIGLNWDSNIAADYSLWGYDTFTQVTGIDDTFTITVEIKVSVS